ncbi:MAG: N-formylglutamate amidohydrolase [Alphaproteobacteria bacterium]|nr:N-formylglutamate amidohydrolase [Alphaproteobacteria bacterium]MCY4320304.1 N-formylglutamate amidohydrolase [Alphaproteobacteria bacterium]
MTLAPEDPPPFTMRPGQADASVAFVCDHASYALPARLGSLGLPEAALRSHIGWDPGAAGVTALLAARFEAPAAFSGYSRLAIDCNRDPEDQTSILAESDGISVPGNRGLDTAARAWRRDMLFEPYHAAIEVMLDGCSALRAFVSVHSFTPHLTDGAPRPWHVGVFWNEDEVLAGPFMAALGAEVGVLVGDNLPYSGRSRRGYTTRRHAEPRDIPHIGLEIRNDLLRDEAGIALWARRIGGALAAALV